MSAQIGEGLTWRVRGGHFWQLVSLATETTGGLILVAFWPKHGLRSYLRVPNFKKFSYGGSMPPDPPSLFTPQWPYHSKIAGSSPVQCFTIVCLEAQNLRGKDRPLLANIQTKEKLQEVG